MYPFQEFYINIDTSTSDGKNDSCSFDIHKSIAIKIKTESYVGLETLDIKLFIFTAYTHLLKRTVYFFCSFMRMEVSQQKKINKLEHLLLLLVFKVTYMVPPFL